MGGALAHRFATPQDPVGLVSNNSSVAELLVEGLRADGVDAHAAITDISDIGGLKDALQGLMAELGEPTVVIYNASTNVSGTPTQVPVDDFVHGLVVGITGALVTLQTVAPVMVARGSGTILFTGSGVSISPWVEEAGLSVQKAGLRNLAIAANAELAPKGVYAATVTIMGALARDTVFDPELIADTFYEVAQRPSDEWLAEIRYTGG